MRLFPFCYRQSGCPAVSSVLSLSEEYAKSLHSLVLSSAFAEVTAELRLSSVLSLSEKDSSSLHSFVISSALTGLTQSDVRYRSSVRSVVEGRGG